MWVPGQKTGANPLRPCEPTKAPPSTPSSFEEARTPPELLAQTVRSSGLKRCPRRPPASLGFLPLSILRPGSWDTWRPPSPVPNPPSLPFQQLYRYSTMFVATSSQRCFSQSPASSTIFQHPIVDNLPTPYLGGSQCHDVMSTLTQKLAPTPLAHVGLMASGFARCVHVNASTEKAVSGWRPVHHTDASEALVGFDSRPLQTSSDNVPTTLSVTEMGDRVLSLR